MNSFESELCCNPSCKLCDLMSTISFMRECISEPMNPGPLFTIRNNFSFTVSLSLFSVIINFENTKIFPLLHFTKKNTTTISFTVYHCIAYFFSLNCLFISSFVYLHTPCAWQPLGEVEGKKQIYFPCRLLEEGHEGSLYTQSPRVRYKPSSHLRGENQPSLCSALCIWSLNLAKHQEDFLAPLPGNP
jgi:hypothetical protein